MSTSRSKQRRLAFTKTKLAELPPPASGRAYYYDDRTPGLAFCITSTDSRTFYFCTKFNGESIRRRLGPFPGLSVENARDLAKELTGDVAKGIDPRKARKASPTLKDLFTHWLAHAKQRKKTWSEDERKWNKYFTSLKSRRLESITPGDVAKWHSKLGEKHGPYLANRTRALLSAMFGEAHKIGYHGPNPCENVQRFKEESRERFLLPDEMRPFFKALDKEPPLWRDFWLLCLFTGARRGNVAAMAWRDLEMNQGIWYLPGKKLKNGLPLAIVLPPPAVAVLQSRLLERDGSEWVFPADTRTGHIQDPRKSWARVTEAAGLLDLRPHDLRRSLGSWQAIAGASLQIIGASLGHRDPKATAVYARLQMDPVRTSVHGAVQSMLEAAKLEEGGEDGEE